MLSQALLKVFYFQSANLVLLFELWIEIPKVIFNLTFETAEPPQGRSSWGLPSGRKEKRAS